MHQRIIKKEKNWKVCICFRQIIMGNEIWLLFQFIRLSVHKKFTKNLDYCSPNYTGPNMTLQVTSEFTRFSDKIENFRKNSINVLTSFLMCARPFLLVVMNKTKPKKSSNHCWYFFSIFHFFNSIYKSYFWC